MEIVLKKGREDVLSRNHQWVFSGAIAKSDPKIVDGDFVKIVDFRGNTLAFGHFHFGSIAIRILGKKDQPVLTDIFHEKLKSAFEYRKQTNFIDNSSTNCFRLIHGEGDGLSGLIIDIYDTVAVIQCHTVGMHRSIDLIINILDNLFEGKLTTIYDKSRESLPDLYAKQINNQFFKGNEESKWVVENGLKLEVNWVTGQKTGFFLDQRDNRNLINKYAKDKKVLNTFCYSGGFSLFALNSGAELVHSIDVSAKAIELCKKNIAANFPDNTNHAEYEADVMTWLKDNKQIYDLIVVDPPAFAKSIDKRHNAVQAYKRLNMLAIQSLAKNGIIFTFSCSQVVDKQLFYDTIVAAAIETKRNIRVLHFLNQPPDHPINIYHPEGSYLKGLVIYVE
ncbi:MAG: class I SAM-dependent rRNA methyltransferase [Saprospiraceae bacterium]|nr:class I SAM-dependent rRNA methyltransferase [Saprospiraceae bacterium]